MEKSILVSWLIFLKIKDQGNKIFQINNGFIGQTSNVVWTRKKVFGTMKLVVGLVKSFVKPFKNNMNFKTEIF